MNKKQNNRKPNIQLHLETLFQATEPEENAPVELEKEVFSTLESLQLVADIVDLFTVKFVQTNVEVLGQIDNENEKTS